MRAVQLEPPEQAGCSSWKAKRRDLAGVPRWSHQESLKLLRQGATASAGP